MRRSIAIAVSMVGCAPPPNVGGADDDGGSGDDGSVDEARLDRSVAEGSCGYPAAGAGGYGDDVGARLANSAAFSLLLCDGTQIQLADYMCRRDDAYGDFNRGILLNIGAGWCGPCQEETIEFPELYAEYHDQGIEFVQVLFQDWTGQTPTEAFCAEWADGEWAIGEGGPTTALDLAYPVVIDQAFDWTSQYMSDAAAAAPVNLLIDANANIRWRLQGQKPQNEVLRAQLDLVVADPYGD